MLIKRITTWDDEIELPLLVLTVNNGYGEFRDPDAWRMIEHQVGGHACMQFKQSCIILPLRETVRMPVLNLTKKWLNSCVGLMGAPTLSTANEYSSDLARLGLTCEWSYHDMKEGLYPIDTTAASLRDLTDSPLPDDLDDLLVFQSDMEKAFGSLGRWQAYILGENCD